LEWEEDDIDKGLFLNIIIL